MKATADIIQVNASGPLRDEELPFHFFQLPSSLLCTIRPDGYAAYLSPAWEKVCGFRREELQAGPILNFIHPEDAGTGFAEAVGCPPADPVTLSFQTRWLCKDGTYKWLQWNIRPVPNEPFVCGIAHDIHAFKQVETLLHQRTHDLQERVKELNCLQQISCLVGRPQVSIPEIIQGTLDIIPPSWQYPEITCARIDVNGGVYHTRSFRETRWKQSAGICAAGEPIGTVEVFYMQAMPERDEGPFLQEERNLIRLIADLLGRAIQRIRVDEIFRENEKLYRTVVEHVSDGMALVQDGKPLLMNSAFLSAFDQEQDCGRPGMEIETLLRWNQYPDLLSALHGGDRPVRKTIECRRPDDRMRWLDLSLIPITFNSRPASVLIARDVTEAKQRERQYQQETSDLREENTILRTTIRERYRFGKIIGRSARMQAVYERIVQAAAVEANVIIYGDSGTGKELVAEEIFRNSRRRDGNLIRVNCAAIPSELIESEFFGYEKGAFSGAGIRKNGLLDSADGGVLFLDEIGEIDQNMQTKLLRALEGGGYNPVGSSQPRYSDFRIVAATNQNLKEQVRSGRMREDFFYRIHVIPIHLPPLKARKEDLPLLIDHFMRIYNDRNGDSRIPGNVMDRLQQYDWPGNVRELQNVLQQYLSIHTLNLSETVRPPAGREPLEPDPAVFPEDGQWDLKTRLEQFEKQVIREALSRVDGNRTRAARMLGLSRRSLQRRIQQYQIPSRHSPSVS